jgi:hypothetical protein
MRRPEGASSLGVTASASDTVFALRGRDKALRSYQLHGTGDTCLRGGPEARLFGLIAPGARFWVLRREDRGRLAGVP